MSTEWIEVSLNDICENKSVACKDFEAEGIEKYVGLEHIEPESLVISSWGLIEEGTTFTKMFYPEQVLFGKRRSYQKKAAVAKFKGVCSGDILVLEAKEDIILPELLPYIIQNDRLFDFAVGTSSGSLSPRTSWKHLSSYKVKIPKDKENQKEIIEKFHVIEEAINLKEKLITSTQKYKKKLMRELLIKGINHQAFKKTDIGEIPEEWESTSLESVIEIKNGYAFESQYYSNEGDYILLTPGNFYPEGGLKLKGEKEKYFVGEINKNFLLNKGDLLVVLTDLTQSCNILGSPAKIDEENKYLHNQRLGKVELSDSKLLKEFLYYLFNDFRYRNHLKNTSSGTTVRHTSVKRILEVKVPVPSLKEQQRIVDILLAVDEQIESYEKEKELSIMIKKGLQEQLLSTSEGVKI